MEDAMEEAENGAKMRSSSPTSSSVPEQRKKPSSSPAPSRVAKPRWLILDRIVHRRSDIVEADATASELAHDCAGRPIRASLRIAEPPAVSHLHLDLPFQPPLEHMPDPVAIAAHRNCILFQLTVPFTDNTRWNHTPSFPDDYFVYTCRLSAAAPASPPSLTLLPPCFHGGLTSPKKYDWSFYKPHCSQQQRSMFEEEIGILCHGNDDDDGEFTVAQLNFSGPDEFELCVLHYPPLAPATSMEWRVQKLKKPTNMMTSAYSWRTDVVLPIGRRCLCWIDNYLGLLLVDVLSDSKSNQDHQLNYIPLPSKALKTRRPYRDGGVADPLRCVSVTDSGIIKLVCIIEKSSPSPCPFDIRTWTLDDIDEGKWTMDVESTMGAEEFFSLLATADDSGLPRVQPSFPLVSLVDPDVICFLLDDMDSDLFWTVEVNMRNKKLLSSAPYINEEEEEDGDGYPPKTAYRDNYFGHRSFIPSNFSSYLGEDASTSQKQSEMMQKSKQSRVMQRSGLEAQLRPCLDG